MRDPWEGLTADGLIRTGVQRDRVPAVFEPVVGAAVEAVSELAAGGELHLYGSVATGTAEPGASDVDLLAIGLAPEQARAIGQQLSRRFAGLCRGVEIGPAGADDFSGDDDECYGNRVFLRHYCVSLYGPDSVRSASPFPGDRRAARGFNGDIGVRLNQWRRELPDTPPSVLGRTVARKTLLAVAGLVSIHDQSWTTDRDSSARRWSHVDARSRAGMQLLASWSSGERVASATELAETLARDGIIASIVEHFAADIGLWPEPD